MQSWVGIDLGQKRDPTALCVTEAEERKKDKRTAWHFLVRHLERLPLRTPYPKVADRVADVVEGVKSRTGMTPGVFADVTGLGEPVTKLIQERIGVRVCNVTFNHGDRQTWEGGRLNLGKGWLVSHLQTLLQSGRLHLPDTAEARVLAEELLEYEIKVDEGANERYGAFRVGRHDDLITALGLAVQQQPKKPRDWSHF